MFTDSILELKEMFWLLNTLGKTVENWGLSQLCIQCHLFFSACPFTKPSVSNVTFTLFSCTSASVTPTTSGQLSSPVPSYSQAAYIPQLLSHSLPNCSSPFMQDCPALYSGLFCPLLINASAFCP